MMGKQVTLSWSQMTRTRCFRAWFIGMHSPAMMVSASNHHWLCRTLGPKHLFKTVTGCHIFSQAFFQRLHWASPHNSRKHQTSMAGGGDWRHQQNTPYFCIQVNYISCLVSSHRPIYIHAFPRNSGILQNVDTCNTVVWATLSGL